MTRTVSSLGPGFELKHRIAGAVILITFAVVVLPVILGGPNPSGSGPPSADIEDAPNGEADTQTFVSKITPITGATPEHAGSSAAPATSEAQHEPAAPSAPRSVSPAVEPESASVSEAPAPSEPREPVSEPTPAAAPTELDRGWIVRVGTYSQSENAKRVMEGLEKLGFNPSSGSVNTRSGAATRVWVGPFAQRVEAARARTRIERGLGQKGLIAAFP